MNSTRRGLLGLALAGMAAPAIVRASSIMPICPSKPRVIAVNGIISVDDKVLVLDHPGGLVTGYDQFVEAQMREIAKSLGLPYRYLIEPILPMYSPASCTYGSVRT